MEEPVKKEDWPPEDEYDALNDETFGGDGEEYSWNAGTVLFNDTEKVKPNGDGAHKREALVANDFGGPYGDQLTKQDYENDFDNENALEESISRLVMDEFDDEDEEEAMKSKLRRLGTTTNFNTYFMPPQVASKHLQWFMDKELPGGSSLLGSSVWSMHPTTAPPEPAPAPTHQPTFSGSQLHSDSINVQINQLTQNSGIKNESTSAKKSDSGVLDRTAINLNNLIGATPSLSSHQSSNVANHKPVFKTVEEIERELLEGNSGAKTPTNEHVDTARSTSSRPKVMTAEELERELILSSTPPRNEADVASMQGTSAQRPRHASPTVHAPSKAQQAVQPPMTPPFSNNVFGSPSGRPPPGLHTPPGMNMNMNMSPMMMQQQRMAHANMGGPNAFPQRMPPGLPHQIPPNIAAQLAYQQQQHLRILQMNPHLRGRLPFLMPFPQMGHPMRHGFPIPPGPHGLASSPGGPGFKRPVKTDDPYGGLMNEKDKQRLRNIQIIQLQNDHPYTTDYYCLMYKVRHGGDPKRQRDFLLKLFPKKSDESSRNRYQPAHFENSLGKLQAVSALAPKKAIDTVIRVVDSGPTNRSGMKAYRYLLLEVEQLYECLLKIQEADIRNSLLHNADESVNEYRTESTDKVIKVLLSEEKLSEILSVKKGKMLISRLIPLMEPEVRYSVFAHMIRNFPSWAVGTNSEIDKTYPFLRHCMFAADMKNLVSMINADLEPKIYEYMVASKLGLSLLFAAFHRAERIISKSLPLDFLITEELISAWVSNARFAVLSVLLNEAELATPIEISPLFLTHMQRFGLNLQEMKVLENKLQSWASNGVPTL